MQPETTLTSFSDQLSPARQQQSTQLQKSYVRQRPATGLEPAAPRGQKPDARAVSEVILLEFRKRPNDVQASKSRRFSSVALTLRVPPGGMDVEFGGFVRLCFLSWTLLREQARCGKGREAVD